MLETSKIIEVMESRGYPVFRNSTKDYNLNLIGIRSKDNKSNAFNDKLIVLWFQNGEWNRLNFDITTDPGVYWRKNPMNVNGTAILCEGHHRSIWSLGFHKGKYKALVQSGLAKVYRDNNKDNVLDTDVNTETGLFGINCHRSTSKGTSIQVDKWSAGCQVFDNSSDYDKFIEICEIASKNWGNKFSYTLLLENWLE